MRLENNLIGTITEEFLEKLKTNPDLKNEDILGCFQQLLYFGKTYQALEIAIALKEKEIFTREIVVDVAYLHYIRMLNSHLSQRTLNEFISIYPEIKQK